MLQHVPRKVIHEKKVLAQLNGSNFLTIKTWSHFKLLSLEQPKNSGWGDFTVLRAVLLHNFAIVRQRMAGRETVVIEKKLEAWKLDQRRTVVSGRRHAKVLDCLPCQEFELSRVLLVFSINRGFSINPIELRGKSNSFLSYANLYCVIRIQCSRKQLFSLVINDEFMNFRYRATCQNIKETFVNYKTKITKRDVPSSAYNNPRSRSELKWSVFS